MLVLIEEGKYGREAYMSTTDAQKRAVKKYNKNNVKQIKINFCPKDHELFDKIKEKGQEYGGLSKYVIDTLKKDIEG